MAAYMHGTLAVEEKQRNRQSEKVRETRKAVTRKKAIPAGEKLIYLGAIALVAVVSGVIIWRYALIYQMNKQIYDMKTSIAKLQEENSILKVKVDAGNDPNILKKAAAESGLKPTTDAQRMRIPAKEAKPADTQVAVKR